MKISNFLIRGNRSLKIFILGVLALGTVKAFSQAIATLKDPELLMGTTTTLNVKIPLPSDSASVEFPLLKESSLQKKKYMSLLNDTIEILTNHKESIYNDGRQHWKNIDLTVQAFDSGKYEIPALDFIVAGQLVKSNPVELTVIPVKAKADDQIEPFTDVSEPFELNPNPEEMEEEGPTLIWWLIVAGIVLLGFIIWLYLRFRKTGIILSLTKPVPPYLQALNKLKKLQKQNLPQRGRTKEYYTKLTDILRTYLKKQYGIKTIEKTSAEILKAVASNSEISQHEILLKGILETADFVKFAKVTPLGTENEKRLREAETFVETTHSDSLKQEKEGGEP